MQELDIAMSHVRTIHRVAGIATHPHTSFNSMASVFNMTQANTQIQLFPYTTQDVRDIKTSLPSNLSPTWWECQIEEAFRWWCLQHCPIEAQQYCQEQKFTGSWSGGEWAW